MSVTENKTLSRERGQWSTDFVCLTVTFTSFVRSFVRSLDVHPITLGC